MPKTGKQKEANRLNAARRRRENPEREREIKRRCWENGGRERAAEYRARKKAEDFFGYRVQFIRRLNKDITAADLRALWEKQDGRCALTGAMLVADARRGIGAELDHIEPVSRGGSSELSNLRWVTHEVNRAKGNLTDAEFFALCEAVAAR